MVRKEPAARCGSSPSMEASTTKAEPEEEWEKFSIIFRPVPKLSAPVAGSHLGIRNFRAVGEAPPGAALEPDFPPLSTSAGPEGVTGSRGPVPTCARGAGRNSAVLACGEGPGWSLDCRRRGLAGTMTEWGWVLTGRSLA